MRTQTTQRRLRTRPGSIKRNGTDGLSGLRIHDLRMVSPCSCSPCHALTLRRDRIATALPPRWDDPRPPAQSLWAATVSGARRRLKPPLTPLASPRQVEAPFPRAYSAYELNSAVLPSLLATPHPIHTVAKVPPVAKLPAVETSPPVARSEKRATPWCRMLYVLQSGFGEIWLRREQSHDRGHDRRHLTGLVCRLRVDGCAKFERKRRRIAFRQGN